MMLAQVFFVPLLLQAPGPTIRVETREVVVDVTATDQKGAAVEGLTRSDFTITDDGKTRAIDDLLVIREFPRYSAIPSSSPLHPPAAAGTDARAPEAPPGHSTAILLDQVNGFFEDAGYVRQKILDLMAKAPADERIALYVMARRQDLLILQDYTTDRDLLRNKLAKYVPAHMNPEPSETFPYTQDAPAELAKPPGLPILPSAPGGAPPKPAKPEGREFKPLPELDMMWRENAEQARTSLQALAEQLARVPGRKSLFWITQTFPFPYIHGMSSLAWDKTIRALNEANVAVNTVDSRGLLTCAPPACLANDPLRGTFASMHLIAERTGGKAYIGRNDIDDAIVAGIAASRTVYSLRFHIPDSERDNRFHELKVKVDRPGVDLLYRQGYDAGATAGPSVDLVAGKIEGKALEARAAESNTLAIGIEMQLSWAYSGVNRARVQLAADFVPTAGTVEVVGVAQRPDGKEAARFAESVTTEPQKPFHYIHPFTMAAGSYTFRLTIGAGEDAVGKKEQPLAIEPWNGSALAIGGITFSKGDPASFFGEVSDPAPAGLTMRFRVIDSIGAIKYDSGFTSVAAQMKPGSTGVPFSAPIPPLPAGVYRLEVSATHPGGNETATRTTALDIQP